MTNVNISTVQHGPYVKRTKSSSGILTEDLIAVNWYYDTKLRETTNTPGFKYVRMKLRELPMRAFHFKLTKNHNWKGYFYTIPNFYVSDPDGPNSQWTEYKGAIPFNYVPEAVPDPFTASEQRISIRKLVRNFWNL